MRDEEEGKEEILEKYRQAGKILSQVRNEAAKKVEVGVHLLEVAEFVEEMIREKNAEPAFPCNISRNDEAAHATPALDDDAVFGNDMVKLDVGVHVDGYIADTAITVDLSDHPDIVEAAEKALSSAIEIIKAGTSTAEIGTIIEETIEGYGYKPVMNLTGHGLAQYNQHAPPTIPNRKVSKGIILKKGDVIAIEPFATDGVGRISERGLPEIYKLEKVRPVRSHEARELLKEIEKYKTLPFAKRWLSIDRLDLAIKQLEKAKVLHAFPILKEDGNGLVSQAEHTVIVQEDGCEVTTL
ncbi:MAG: type II methionyl aminopeptidase [Halobacteriota archaeon]|nr:type II methionyl aminopeptidase [Halobacteriota archaeon]